MATMSQTGLENQYRMRLGCTAGELAAHVGGELVGEGSIQLTGVAELSQAEAGELTFIGDASYAEKWSQSKAAAALVVRGLELEAGFGRALIVVENADLAMARALELFAPPPSLPQPGIHRSASVDPTAEVGEGVRIGPNCVVGPGVRLGANVVLHASVTVLDDVHIGEGSVLWPGTVVRERCRIGRRCVLDANVSIGGEGFGYRPDPETGSLVHMPHIGLVEIGDDVEIGAGTCIDRGKFAATTIGAGTKIDSLVQIGHNCRIGQHVVIAGCCGIAGSVTIGDGSMLGGMAAVKDHITIGKGVRLTGCAQLMNDVPDGEAWGGSPAQPYRDAVRQAQALKKLPELVKAARGR